jgi:hypothetical protein
LAARIAVLVKLARLWLVAPPFFLQRKAHSSGYLETLLATSASPRHWIVAILLLGATTASIEFNGDWPNLASARSGVGFQILPALREPSVIVATALVTASFLHVVRWHVCRRLERLRNRAGNTVS